MEVTMSAKGRYGFVGLGQMGGNVVKIIHAKGYSVIAANTAQSDLDSYGQIPYIVFHNPDYQ